MNKMEEIKRKRSENWNEEDKMLLKELIRKRVKEIENKNTDTNTNQAKKKAWLEVAESFNTLCTGGQRTVTQLKNQWVATKIVAKKEVAQNRKEIRKTGGGSGPQELPVSSHDISVWLPNEFVVDTNEFDSDAFTNEIVENIIKPTTDNETIIIMDNETDKLPETVSDNIVKSTPNITKKKINKNTTEQQLKQLTELEMQCKSELHHLQVEVEKNKLRNLNREFDLIEAKIKFYEKKSVDK